MNPRRTGREILVRTPHRHCQQVVLGVHIQNTAIPRYQKQITNSLVNIAPPNTKSKHPCLDHSHITWDGEFSSFEKLRCHIEDIMEIGDVLYLYQRCAETFQTLDHNKTWHKKDSLKYPFISSDVANLVKVFKQLEEILGENQTSWN